jgi:hypothetical protein
VPDTAVLSTWYDTLVNTDVEYVTEDAYPVSVAAEAGVDAISGSTPAASAHAVRDAKRRTIISPSRPECSDRV